MDDNLVGYLLNSLDDDAHREMEAYLAASAEGRHKLEVLRRVLEPLAADAEESAPPADLVIRTLGRVAEYCSRDLPRAPSTGRVSGGERPRWRRLDYIVAAGILLTAMGLGVPALWQLQGRSAPLIECKESLRVFHTALQAYHAQHGQFPNVKKAEAPHAVAGLVVPMLIDAGVLSPNMNVRCPGNGAERTCPVTLEQIKNMDAQEFKTYAPTLASCYAYSLGCLDETGGYQGPHYNILTARYPIMSDRPPGDASPGNSPNHGGSGQNVLFQDGHVEFITGRSLEFDDDIFLSKDKKVEPGKDANDVVLGSSSASP